MSHHLLDTCALLALASGTLPELAARALASGAPATVPAVVVWELAIKVRTGKLELPDDPLSWAEQVCSRHSIELQRRMPDVSILCAAANLPPVHRDPFDRVIVATALAHDLTILTADRLIPDYPGARVIW